MIEAINLINRLFCFLAYGFALYYVSQITVAEKLLPSHLSYLSGKLGFKQFAFLTVWNLLFHFLFYGICLLSKYYRDFTVKFPNGNEFIDKIYHSIMVPLALLVFIIHWSIHLSMSVDNVWLKESQDSIPSWLNHLVHTVIVPCIMLEGYLNYHIFPDRLSGQVIYLTVVFLYMTILGYVLVINQVYIYPLYDIVPVHYMAVFAIFFITFGLLLFHFGHFIHRLYWTNEIEDNSNKLK